MDFWLKPRIRAYTPRVDRSGFTDRSAEKAAQRARVLQEAKDKEARVKSFIVGGELDFAELKEPVPPDVRAIFLAWLAIANLSPDGRGRTEYGQTFTVFRKSNGTCKMRCTDGNLTMPDCKLIFEEGEQVE